VYKQTEGESRLEQSEEEYQTMFELAEVGVAQVDPATDRFVRVNPRLCQITGYSEEELLDMTFLEITHFEHRNGNYESFQRFVRGELPEYKAEKRYVHRDGHAMWVKVNATVIRSETGRPLRTVAIIQDITERKEAEETRARLAAIIEYSEDAIIGKTLDGIITSWNKGAQKIYGYSEEEVVGKPINVLVSPERPDEIPKILASIRRGEAVEHYETVRMTKDGRYLNISLTVSPISP